MAKNKKSRLEERDVLNRIGDVLDALSSDLSSWLIDWASRPDESDEPGLEASLRLVCGKREHELTSLLDRLATIDRQRACLVYPSVRAFLNVRLPPTGNERQDQFEEFEVCEPDVNETLDDQVEHDDHGGTVPVPEISRNATPHEHQAMSAMDELSELEVFCRYINNHRQSVDNIWVGDPDDLKGIENYYARRLGSIVSGLHDTAKTFRYDAVKEAMTAKLSKKQVNILQAMRKMKAIDQDSKVHGDDIAEKAFGEDSRTGVKRDMAQLRLIGLVESNTGSGSGSWLTAAGISRADKLVNSKRTD